VNDRPDVLEHNAVRPVVPKDVDAGQLSLRVKTLAAWWFPWIRTTSMPASRNRASCARRYRPGNEVLPIPVVVVACDHQKLRLLVDAQLGERLERLPRRTAHRVDGRARIGGPTLDRAVEVQIGGVDKFHEHSIDTDEVGCSGPNLTTVRTRAAAMTRTAD
jgi:hypothetical protein